MASLKYGVSAEKEEALHEKMEELGIREEDVVERFIRSRGHGGQNVNKVSTCVYLKHLPTGIEVKCQKERSQALNRFLARRILAEKIENLLLGKQSAEQQRIEKIRREASRLARQKKVLELNISSRAKASSAANPTCQNIDTNSPSCIVSGTTLSGVRRLLCHPCSNAGQRRRVVAYGCPAK
jgi:protein subunit release factor B